MEDSFEWCYGYRYVEAPRNVSSIHKDLLFSDGMHDGRSDRSPSVECLGTKEEQKKEKRKKKKEERKKKRKDRKDKKRRHRSKDRDCSSRTHRDRSRDQRDNNAMREKIRESEKIKKIKKEPTDEFEKKYHGDRSWKRDSSRRDRDQSRDRRDKREKDEKNGKDDRNKKRRKDEKEKSVYRKRDRDGSGEKSDAMNRNTVQTGNQKNRDDDQVSNVVKKNEGGKDKSDGQKIKQEPATKIQPRDPKTGQLIVEDGPPREPWRYNGNQANLWIKSFAERAKWYADRGLTDFDLLFGSTDPHTVAYEKWLDTQRFSV